MEKRSCYYGVSEHTPRNSQPVKLKANSITTVKTKSFFKKSLLYLLKGPSKKTNHHLSSGISSLLKLYKQKSEQVDSQQKA